MTSRLLRTYQQHQPFAVVLVLFVSFRLLALLTLRIGGFFADYSDYEFYYAWGQLTAMGYQPFQDLWAAYPPLFPALMLPIFELSSRIPPWSDPRLFFHGLFGLFLLLFETGNLILIYRLALKLQADEETAPSGSAEFRMPPALWSAILYALLFVPAYTMMGWFDTMPLFFMLLGLDLLLSKSRWGWPASAVAVALGFLVKLTPMLVVPIAIRWLGAKLSWRAARTEWFDRRSPANLLRPAVYTTIFFGVAGGLGYWLSNGNLALGFSSFHIQSIRPPWQSVWALIDGFYGYGLVPLDMRNLVSFETYQWESRIPWTWVTLAFVGIYLWLYTRRYDWARIRTPIVFNAVSMIWLLLYSKGWSPQFLVWILAFVVLLNPSMRTILVAVALSVINGIETYVYLMMLPDEHWIMVAAVLLRTALLLLLAAEFVGQIWPLGERKQSIERWSGRLSWATLLVSLFVALLGAPRAAQAYEARRWQEETCQPAIAYLQEQTEWPNRTIVSEDLNVWRDFYPWLREDYDIRILDTYSAIDEAPESVLARQLDELIREGEFWWVEREPSIAAQTYFTGPTVEVLDRQKLGACVLARIVPHVSGEPMGSDRCCRRTDRIEVDGDGIGRGG